jgi:hypothetical protein
MFHVLYPFVTYLLTAAGTVVVVEKIMGSCQFRSNEEIKQFEEACLLGYIPLEIIRHFGRTCRLHLQGLRINQAGNQRESWCSQPATRCYVPEDRILYNHCCENLRSCVESNLFMKERVLCVL